MNSDNDGNPLDTVVRIYQLSGTSRANSLDFNELWQTGKDALGDEFVSETEQTIIAGRPFSTTIAPDKQATHVLVAALLRRPVSNTWYRLYEIPKHHGEAACDSGEENYPDPCFFAVIDANQVDGGLTPPASFDRSQIQLACAPLSSPKKIKREEPTAEEDDGPSAFDRAKSGAQKGKAGADKGKAGVDAGKGGVDAGKGAVDAGKNAPKSVPSGLPK